MDGKHVTAGHRPFGSGIRVGLELDLQLRPRARPLARRSRAGFPDGPSKTIEVPFEIVVVCGPDGAVIHPGGYLLTSKSLNSRQERQHRGT